ncbi:MAG: LptE family protein [Bacteroidales bacterium]
MKNTRKIILLSILPLVFGFQGCTINYSFSGASTEGLETLNVQYFPNRAPIIVPTLSQEFTDAMIEKMRSQTNLILVNGPADATFEGEIRDYSTKSVAITGDDRPAKNRLTISVRIKFTNLVDPDLSFDQTFSRYEEYGATDNLPSIQATLIDDITEQIIEDVFNKAFVNW